MLIHAGIPQKPRQQNETPEYNPANDSGALGLTIPHYASTLTPMDSADEDEHAKPGTLSRSESQSDGKVRNRFTGESIEAISSTSIPVRGMASLWAPSTDKNCDRPSHSYTAGQYPPYEDSMSTQLPETGTATLSWIKHHASGLNTMTGMKCDNEETSSSQVSLPSPVSDDESMDISAPSDADNVQYSPRDASMTPEFTQQSRSKSSNAFVQPTARENTRNEPSGPRKAPRIVMGYRRGCEKCQAGVPGHYLHILHR